MRKIGYYLILKKPYIVDMNGENRILSYHGLKLLNTDTRIGLKQVLKRGEQNVSEIINYDPRVSVNTINVIPYESGIQIEADLVYVPYSIAETLRFRFDQSAGLV